ncbi:MAG TPA: PPK2 family polyphosphate kinase [Nitrososphaerales archaeon]|nr:PPK2 family polyphosphate kinase [Nitrososphaerales archaeon]
MMDTSTFRVNPGQKIKIADLDPDDTSAADEKKSESKDEVRKLTKKLDSLQEMLYAEHQHKVLIVLQAMDTGGKDGVIRRIFEGVNPSGVRVAHFREPSQEEKDHGFLWRAYEQVPGNGEIVIFNRSHYEGVLVERVHNIVSKNVWEKRYGEINEFEGLLVEEGTTIIKFYFHIDSQEQKRRIQERLKDPTKEWKFSVDDLAERKNWADYMNAYEAILNKTSLEKSPWYVIPSNHKWFRDLLVATILVETLESFRMKYPKLPKQYKASKLN